MLSDTTRRPRHYTYPAGCCRCDSAVKHRRLSDAERARVLATYQIGVRDITDALIATGKPIRYARNHAKGYLECVLAAIPRIERTTQMSELAGLFKGDPTGFTAVARAMGLIPNHSDNSKRNKV